MAVLLLIVADTTGQESSPKDKPSLPQRVTEALKAIPDDATLDQKILSDGADKVLATSGDATYSVLKGIFQESDSLPLRRKILLVVRKLELNQGPELFIEVLKTGKSDQEKELALDFLRDSPTEETVRGIALLTVGAASNRLRSKAHRALVTMADEKHDLVVKALKGMVNTPGTAGEAPLMRKAGLAAIARIGGTDISDFLYRQLSSLDDEVRLGAAKAVGRRHFLPAVERLQDMMVSDTSAAVRREAVCSAGMLNSESVVPQLIEALGDNDEGVKRSALRVLTKFTGQALGPHKDLWTMWWKQHTEELNQLSGMLDDKSDEVVLRAIAALGKKTVSRREIAEAVAPFLNSGSRDVRHAALRALGSLGQEESVPALLEALDTNDSVALAAAIEALGQMKRDRERIAVAVGEFVSDYDDKVATAACITLGNLGSQTAAPALLEALNDLEGKPLFAAIQATGRIGAKSDEICAALESLIDYDDSVIAIEACTVLGQLRNRKAVPALIDALLDQRVPVAHAAYKSLKTITSKNLPENHDDWMAWWREVESAGGNP